jgi:integrase
VVRPAQATEEITESLNGHVEKCVGKTVRWQVRLYVDAAHGGPRRRSGGTFALKREAEAALARILARHHDGTYRELSTITVAELIDRWLAEYVAQLRPTTRRVYGIYCTHVLRALGDELAETLAPGDVSSLLAHLLSAGLSPKYVSQVRLVLHGAYAWAVKLGELRANPVDAVPAPAIPERICDPPGIEDMRGYIDALAGTRFQLPVAIAAGTGMRRGEILGLSWRHIDLVPGLVHVRRQAVDVRKGCNNAVGTKGRSTIALSVPKTAAAVRDVWLPPFVVELLGKERSRQQLKARIGGYIWSVDDPVCQDKFGNALRPDQFTRDFGRAIRSRGLKPMRFHDFRHAVATEMIRRGIPPGTVQRQLGHANVGITLGVYGHVRPADLEDAAKRMNEAWEEKKALPDQLAVRRRRKETA